MDSKVIDLELSRRSFLKSAGIAGAAAGTSLGLLDNAWAQIRQMESQGWSRHPVACTMCGAFCGLLAMRKDGAPVSEKTVRIVPNPGHPQRGYCGRAASTMWIWNHPLRLRKPLKRIGERGSGKFQQVTWDEALNDIAARLKAVVDKYGEASVSSTSHAFSGLNKWFTFALGSPNNIGHEATCNQAGIGAREWVYGPGFGGAGKIEPDYAHLRYLILIGRSMCASMGVVHTLNEARANGAHVVAVDPRMPELAYGDAEWIGIRPGTDAAFVLALMHVMVHEGLVDLKFLAHHTNGAYLVLPNGQPLTQACLKAGGQADLFALFDAKTQKIVFQGTTHNAKGANTGFIEDSATEPDLEWAGDLVLADGSTQTCRTAWSLIRREIDKFPPEKASAETGIATDKIIAVARNFANFKGVIDDGWYTSKNGNDVSLYRLIGVANALNGNFDREGGMIVTQGAGFNTPSMSLGKGPNGEKFPVAKEKRIDKIEFPMTHASYFAALNAMLTGKPYPIRAAFIVGTTMFHREANSERLAKALKSLDLMVVQDLLPHEICDWADYVLPATYFLERKDIAGVKWARDGSIHISDTGIRPPEGCEARHDVWILLEILRRAYPERAARAGYSECKTAEEFDEYFNKFLDKGLASFCRKKNEAKPGEGDRILADLKKDGYSLIAKKKYGQYPYKKCFGTPTGKIEIYGFMSFKKKGFERVPALPVYTQPPAYTQPKPLTDQFYLISGKSSSSCSGLAMFASTTKYIGDRTVWMNPIDARRLGIASGSMIEITGIDNAVVGHSRVTVTTRVVPGTLFSYGFSGAVRTKTLVNDQRFAFVKEGINSHWFATGYAEPVIGNLANNSSVRVTSVKE